MSERPLPESIDTEELAGLYDAALRHCSSCHEDLDYGFSEAIEPVVVQLPDGSYRTHHDSCCQFLSDLRANDIPHVDGWDYQRGEDPEATREEGK